jgi:hypothetical protein
VSHRLGAAIGDCPNPSQHFPHRVSVAVARGYSANDALPVQLSWLEDIELLFEWCAGPSHHNLLAQPLPWGDGHFFALLSGRWDLP